MLVGLAIPFALQVTGLDGNEEGLTLLCNGLQVTSKLHPRFAGCNRHHGDSMVPDLAYLGHHCLPCPWRPIQQDALWMPEQPTVENIWTQKWPLHLRHLRKVQTS